VPHWISEAANAKINLALHVLGKRSDGYHELDSVVAFAGIGDELRLKLANDLELRCIGPFASQVPHGEDNIIVKAWHVLREILEVQNIVLPKVTVELTKNLPVASGIGGGSADAAAMIRALLKIINHTLSADEVKALALSLGADVPVCFYQKPCRMQGIGETLSMLEIELPRAIVLINPLLPCATAEVFKNLGLKNGQAFGNVISLENPPSWRNDLSEPAFKAQPEIKKVLAALKQEPCFSETRMSGSGATCFGLTNSMAEASSAVARLSVKNPSWWIKAAEILPAKNS
jgi:4-diphosphocytidyl-2-C-methyl-D-erythritol kinase